MGAEQQDRSSAPAGPTAATLDSVQQAAHLAAHAEFERRTLTMSASTIVLSTIHLLETAHTAAQSRALWQSLAVGVGFTLARIAINARARRLPITCRARWLWFLVPLLVQVTLWSSLIAWSAVRSEDLGEATFMVATLALSSTAVLVGQSGQPWLAFTLVQLLMVPIGVLLLGGDAPGMPGLGGGALFYDVMMMTFLPRIARERRASLLTVAMLEERARSLEAAHDAALQASAAKDRLHANLSHEIRTPLNGLLGVIGRLRRSHRDGELGEGLEQIDRCGQSLLLLLNDALDAVALDAGRLRLQPVTFDPMLLVDDVVALFRATAADKGLALRRLPTAHAAQCAHVVGDAQRVRQVLQNLIGNAVKYTDAGSVTVEVQLHAASGRAAEDAAQGAIELVLVVRDTGRGFDPSDAPRLFQRFERLSGASQKAGTGLGLAIARELVALMDGELTATSDGAGRGATFSVRLPLARATTAHAADLRGWRVLVVDDNPLNLAVARAYLLVLGCNVDGASSGNDAVRLAAHGDYDVILMDCVMPGMSGPEAAVRIKSARPAVPIVACTASEDEATEQAARSAGMELFVRKPVSSETLLAALVRIDRGGQSGSAAAAAVNPAAPT